MTAVRAYARTQNETASKERLMVLLLQTAFRHMHAAARHFQDKRYAEGITATSKAQDIVGELLATLDARRAPELCNQLTAIYTFVLDRLVKGIIARQPQPILEAARAFEPIASGFAEAVQKLESTAHR